jgi:transposase
MERERPFMGIDVSKAALDLCLSSSGGSWQAEYRPTGISAFAEELVVLEAAVAVVEATGCLEASLALALGSGGLPVAVVDPRRVQDYARSTWRLARTDKVDAQTLARFGAKAHPPVRPLPGAVRR